MFKNSNDNKEYKLCITDINLYIQIRFACIIYAIILSRYAILTITSMITHTPKNTLSFYATSSLGLVAFVIITILILSFYCSLPYRLKPPIITEKEIKQ